MSTWATSAFLNEPYCFYHSSDTAQKGPTFFPSTGGLVWPQDAHSKNDMPRPSTAVQPPLQESYPRCCPSVLSRSKENVDRLQYCPEHLLVLTSKPQKTIWRGHAPMDINNWKVSWSCQVYFRKTRAIRRFLAHCCSEIPPPDRELVVEALLKFYWVTPHVQFIFPHSCKMW